MRNYKFYYGIKPMVPACLRRAVRRWFALRKRGKTAGVWPILPGSECPPAGWPGWPEGKKFAFVLTHDVEGQNGLDHCRRLMQLEMKYGFRSSFNFIPEGHYRVSKELRDELTGHGFEVAVHDLRHDGKLYRNREEFAISAAKINSYLKQWGADGFRSGFMFHDLDWLHDLDIQYDTSTFDTDPFEPQSDGAGTIFPFWKDVAPGRGYVELPYTLPQDSTLFLLFRERDINLWLRKLDWIVAHGGMALSNVHPDYIRLPGEAAGSWNYDAELYEQFLRHVSERYAHLYWTALPRDVAAWYKKSMATAPCPAATHEIAEIMGGARARDDVRSCRPRGRVAVVLYSYYESDPRPMREAEALAQAGFDVQVISLRHHPQDPAREVIRGVNVLRIPLRRRRAGKLVYLLQYGWFLAAAFMILGYWSLRRRYRIVHVHNMPDALVFAALAPKLRGARIILDLHDPMPELFSSIYGVPREHFISRCLRWLEKRSTGFADLVLTPNLAFHRLFSNRSCPGEKIKIIMNTPDAAIFYDREDSAPEKPGRERDFVMMYHGLLVERHGLDLAVQALARLGGRIPRIRFEIYGDHTDYVDRVLAQARTLGVEDKVFFHGFKPLSEIALAIRRIDLGLVPNRLNSFTAINLPTRIFEYLAMNKPVIVPKTEGISDYFTGNNMLFFEPGDAEDLARRIEWAWSHSAELRTMMENGREVFRRYSWDQEHKRFLRAVDHLLEGTKEPVSTAMSFSPSCKKICMICYSHYDTDNRVMRYAEELASRGNSVDVLGLKGDRAQPGSESVNGVQVLRIQDRLRKNERSKTAYLFPIVRFWFHAFWRVSREHARSPYDLIHVHNIPDFLVFAAAYAKLAGARVILDAHDIVPEFYASKFSLDSGSLGVRLLTFVERMSARFADHVIISNHLWRDKFVRRAGVEEKCSVFINNVNPKIFKSRPRQRHDGKFIILYPGGLQFHQGLDIALRALQKVCPRAPEAEFHVYGDGMAKNSLITLARELGLERKVFFFEPLPLRQISEVMAQADLSVVPKRADGFGNEAYSTKIMEFMSLGVPAIVSDTRIDRFYFNDSVVRFFESGNHEALAGAMLEMIEQPELRRQMVARASAYAAENSWDNRKWDYINLVDRLCGKTSPAPVIEARRVEASHAP